MIRTTTLVPLILASVFSGLFFYPQPTFAAGEQRDWNSCTDIYAASVPNYMAMSLLTVNRKLSELARLHELNRRPSLTSEEVQEQRVLKDNLRKLTILVPGGKKAFYTSHWILKVATANGRVEPEDIPSILGNGGGTYYFQQAIEIYQVGELPNDLNSEAMTKVSITKEVLPKWSTSAMAVNIDRTLALLEYYGAEIEDGEVAMSQSVVTPKINFQKLSGESSPLYPKPGCKGAVLCFNEGLGHIVQLYGDQTIRGEKIAATHYLDFLVAASHSMFDIAMGKTQKNFQLSLFHRLQRQWARQAVQIHKNEFPAITRLAFDRLTEAQAAAIVDLKTPVHLLTDTERSSVQVGGVAFLGRGIASDNQPTVATYLYGVDEQGRTPSDFSRVLKTLSFGFGPLAGKFSGHIPVQLHNSTGSETTLNTDHQGLTNYPFGRGRRESYAVSRSMGDARALGFRLDIGRADVFDQESRERQPRFFPVTTVEFRDSKSGETFRESYLGIVASMGQKNSPMVDELMNSVDGSPARLWVARTKGGHPPYAMSLQFSHGDDSVLFSDIQLANVLARVDIVRAKETLNDEDYGSLLLAMGTRGQRVDALITAQQIERGYAPDPSRWRTFLKLELKSLRGDPGAIRQIYGDRGVTAKIIKHYRSLRQRFPQAFPVREEDLPKRNGFPSYDTSSINDEQLAEHWLRRYLSRFDLVSNPIEDANQWQSPRTSPFTFPPTMFVYNDPRIDHIDLPAGLPMMGVPFDRFSMFDR